MSVFSWFENHFHKSLLLCLLHYDWKDLWMRTTLAPFRKKLYYVLKPVSSTSGYVDLENEKIQANCNIAPLLIPNRTRYISKDITQSGGLIIDKIMGEGQSAVVDLRTWTTQQHVRIRGRNHWCCSWECHLSCAQLHRSVNFHMWYLLRPWYVKYLVVYVSLKTKFWRQHMVP